LFDGRDKMIGKLWMKTDEEFSQCVIDPAKRKSEIRKLCTNRRIIIACAGFVFLILFGFSSIRIVMRDPVLDTHFLFIFVRALLQVTILYHLDSKIRILKILDRVLIEGDNHEAEGGNNH